MSEKQSQGLWLFAAQEEKFDLFSVENELKQCF